MRTKFTGFRQLLRTLKDIVVLKDDPGIDDISVYPAGDASELSNIPILLRRLTRRARKFTQNAEKRRNILKIIFVAIEQQQPFSREDIYERVANMETEDLPSRSMVRHYLTFLIRKKDVFSWESSQDTLKTFDRMMSLRENINTEDAFIRAYEQSIAFSLRKLLSGEQQFSASLLVEILGLPKDEKELAYCQSLIDALSLEEDDDSVAALIRKLNEFCQDTNKRRNTLKITFAAITQQRSFRFDEIYDRIEKMNIENKPLYNVVQGYLKNAYYEQCFGWPASQEGLPAEKRTFYLKEQINTEDVFIRAYEQSIAYRLRKLVMDKQKFSASPLAEILGLQKNEEELAYCQSLIDSLAPEEDDDSVAALLWKLDRKVDGFCQGADERRRTLKITFAAITQQRSFHFDEIYDRIEKMDIENKPLYNVVQGYLKSAYYEQCFGWPASQEELPAGKRQLYFKEQINTEDAFIRAYEQCVAFKLRKLVRDKQKLSASLLAEILGLPKDAEGLAYCQSLRGDLVPADTASADGVG